MLPLGVVIPTRNSMRYLPEHVERLNAWIPVAQQVIVVDSESIDGTPEYLREHLKHPKLEFFKHPPGLYQSWNFGISKLQTEFTYVSTIGDHASQEGIGHLCGVCESLGGDVCVSPPEFKETDCVPQFGLNWPVHDMISVLKISDPQLVEPSDVLFFAIRSGLRSVLGSSASNIYRTRVLQQYPFPTEYKSIGDTAWGLLYAHKVRFAISPRQCATFLLHDCQHEQNVEALAQQIFALARQVVAETVTSPVASSKGWFADLLLEIASYSYYRRRVQLERLRPIPWMLNPQAWRLRSIRNRHRELVKTKQEKIQLMGDLPPYLKEELLRFGL